MTKKKQFDTLRGHSSSSVVNWFILMSVSIIPYEYCQLKAMKEKTQIFKQKNILNMRSRRCHVTTITNYELLKITLGLNWKIWLYAC